MEDEFTPLLPDVPISLSTIRSVLREQIIDTIARVDFIDCLSPYEKDEVKKALRTGRIPVWLADRMKILAGQEKKNV